MSFDKELRSMIDDIEVPEELSPANIAAMLKKTAPRQTEEINMSAEEKRENITVRKTSSNRSVLMRTLAAAAACVALAAGFWAFTDEQSTEPIEIESEIEYEAVQVQTYDELYNIYTGIYLRNSGESAGNGDGVEIETDETAITGTSAPTVTEPAETEAPPIVSADDRSSDSDDRREPAIADIPSDFSEADIVKSDESYIYYISGQTLYVVSKSDMTVAATVDAEQPPVEVYVNGSCVVLISEENASSSLQDESVTAQTSQKNVVVGIYSVSKASENGTAELTHIKTYKQNGEFTSAKMSDDGTLYLVTGYSDYRTAPLDETSNIENYVPGYYIDGEKYYVAAEDITVPANANSTDYTVVSSIECISGGRVSVKAVLGSSVNAFCSDDTLYIAGVGRRNDSDYTIITSFGLSENGLVYKASGSVEGALASRYSMSVYDGCFRIGCRTTEENGLASTAVYVLDDSLKVIKSAGQLLPGSITDSVKFNENYAGIYVNGGSEPSLVVDLSSTTPVQADNSSCYYGSYVSRYSDTRMVGISAVLDENGNSSALKLEMYDSDSGNVCAEVVFAEYTGVTSPALYDKKALLADSEYQVIGIPVSSVNEFGVKNQYYVYKYADDTGFTLIGTVEYNDIDDSCRFDRAVITDGVIYIMGSGRMVSAQLWDMTVTGTFDLSDAE